MCFGGSQPASQVPALPPPLPPPPTAADPQVARSRLQSRQRAALAGGRAGTIKTSGLGLLAPAETAKKSVTGT